MKFDFESFIDRKGKESRSYDGIGLPGNPTKALDGFDTIPFFVSDMEFAVAPSITKAIEERIKHPIYGYFDIPESFYDAVIYWHKKNKETFDLTKNEIGYQVDVLAGLVSALKALNKTGDKILLHRPTYVGFTNILADQGFEAVFTDLLIDEEGIYRIDFEDMEKKIVENNISTIIMCDPHNPIGRMWEKWELEKSSEIFERHSCKVISDEIWSDININGHVHIPIYNGSEYLKNNSVALYSANKGFNIAGLPISYHVIYNPEIKAKVEKVSNSTYYNHMNILALHAMIGAFSEEGYEWNKEVNQVITNNVNMIGDYVDNVFKGIKYSKPQGTYLIFLDCEEWCKENNVSMDDLLKRGFDYGIGWADARAFASDYGIRLNVALQNSRMKEALDRMEKYVFTKWD